ncbi:MAG: hypothetical protein ACREHG_03920 [Candidatus Saccharimonadales bacterium]
MLERLSHKITSRKVQIALGWLWLLDGALQLQPRMFSGSFARQVISPASASQPVFVSGAMHLGIQTILQNPLLFDLLFGFIQLGIGGLILYKRTARWGLIASIVWGLSIWLFGEGLGGLATGQATLLTGAPGAALLYAVIALGVLPKKSEATRRPANWLPYAWLVLWMGGGVLLVWASRGMNSMMASMVSGMANGAPAWLASIDTHTSSWLIGSGNGLIFALVIIYMAVGFMGILSRGWRALGIAIGTVLALVFWVVGQSLGSFYSGLATDPNTGPLIILLGLAVLGTQAVGVLDTA